MNNPFSNFFQLQHGRLFEEPKEPLSDLTKKHREIEIVFDMIL